MQRFEIPKIEFSQKQAWLWVGIWIIIGFILRFTQLTAKPPWTDEFATMVFSLGNNFDSVPLNQLISVETLLEPLKINPNATAHDVISLIVQEDNHPPLYFILCHWWVKLFPPDGKYVSLFAMRSLPALFGVLAIPLSYLLGKVAFRSVLAGQFAAAMMAVSPYGIYLSQEARHYTIGILFVTASLICLVRTIWYLEARKLIPIGLIVSWIVINSLGILTHYFFSITLSAIALTLLIDWLIQFRSNIDWNNWFRIGVVGLGTLTTAAIWFLRVVPRDYGKGMTYWLVHYVTDFLSFISPIVQLIAGWVVMIALLPIEANSLVIIVLSAIAMILFFVWLVPLMIRVLRQAWQSSTFKVGLATLGGFFISANLLFLLITYILKHDITKAARYNFAYFPAVIAVMGLVLAFLWKQEKIKKNLFHIKTGKQAVILILLIGFFSALTVCYNLGYRKYYLPDQLVKVIQEKSTEPILIATPYRSLVQVGEMMGVAREFKKVSATEDVSFYLMPDDSLTKVQINLENLLSTINSSVEVWAINCTDKFRKNFEGRLQLPSCEENLEQKVYINGYGYQHFQCAKPRPIKL